MMPDEFLWLNIVWTYIGLKEENFIDGAAFSDEGRPEDGFASNMINSPAVGTSAPNRTPQIDNRSAMRSSKQQRLLRPLDSVWSHLCHPLLGRLTTIPESILNDCERYATKHILILPTCGISVQMKGLCQISRIYVGQEVVKYAHIA